MAYIEGTCPLPYPPADPAPRDEVLAHCYRDPRYFGRKCWWYEAGCCFNPIPENPRYPHRPGAAHKMLMEHERPDENIDRAMMASCKAQKWRLFDPSPSAIVVAWVGDGCNDLPIEDACSIITPSACVERVGYPYED